jgi:hypothetical protein
MFIHSEYIWIFPKIVFIIEIPKNKNLKLFSYETIFRFFAFSFPALDTNPKDLASSVRFALRVPLMIFLRLACSCTCRQHNCKWVSCREPHLRQTCRRSTRLRKQFGRAFNAQLDPVEFCAATKGPRRRLQNFGPPGAPPNQNITLAP